MTLLTPSFSVMSFNVQPPSRSHKAITDSTLVVGFFVIGVYGKAPQIPTGQR